MFTYDSDYTESTWRHEADIHELAELDRDRRDMQETPSPPLQMKLNFVCCEVCGIVTALLDPICLPAIVIDHGENMAWASLAVIDEATLSRHVAVRHGFDDRSFHRFSECPCRTKEGQMITYPTWEEIDKVYRDGEYPSFKEDDFPLGREAPLIVDTDGSLSCFILGLEMGMRIMAARKKVK